MTQKVFSLQFLGNILKFKSFIKRYQKKKINLIFKISVLRISLEQPFLCKNYQLSNQRKMKKQLLKNS